MIPQPQESSHVSLGALLDLIDALEPELEMLPGLTYLWAVELHRELKMALGTADAS